MINISRTQAEKRFAATKKRQQAIPTKKDNAAEVVRKKSAKLKALRLLKEAEDLRA